MENELNNKSITLQRILEAAQKEFATKGFGGASIEIIAINSNVTRQLIYHYFKTKERLYEATLELVSRSAQLLLDLESYRSLDAIEALTLLVDRIIDENVKFPLYAAMGLDQGLHQGAHITDGNLYIPNTKRFIELIIQPIIEKGETNGELRSGLDADLVYWLIFHVVTGCFRDRHVMSETTNVDFNSSEGISLWRNTAIDFILHALENNK